MPLSIFPISLYVILYSYYYNNKYFVSIESFHTFYRKGNVPHYIFDRALNRARDRFHSPVMSMPESERRRLFNCFQNRRSIELSWKAERWQLHL